MLADNVGRGSVHQIPVIYELRVFQVEVEDRPAIFAFVLGIGLMLGGIALRWYSARILGKYFTFDVTTQGRSFSGMFQH